MQRKRLVVITDTLAAFGGGERYVLELTSRIRDTYDITLVDHVSNKSIVRMPKHRLERQYKLKGVRIIDLKCTSRRFRVFGTEEFQFMYPTIAAIAKLKEAIKDADIVYDISFNPMVMFYAIIFSKLYKKRFVLGVHNPVFYKIFSKDVGPSQRILSRLYRSVMLGQVRFFHVLNPDDMRIVKKNFPKAKVYHIPLFLTTGAEPKMSDKKYFSALYVGRLEQYQKGIDTLLDVIKRVHSKDKGIAFDIVGSRGSGEELVRQASQTMKNVRWHGFVDDNKRNKQYMKASVLVFPSRFETFPAVVLEAQSYGLPVIAFDIKGIRDIIKKDYQGKILSEEDTAGFADAVMSYKNAMDKDKASYLDMMKKIFANIKSGEYSDSAVVAKIKRMFG